MWFVLKKEEYHVLWDSLEAQKRGPFFKVVKELMDSFFSF